MTKACKFKANARILAKPLKFQFKVMLISGESVQLIAKRKGLDYRKHHQWLARKMAHKGKKKYREVRRNL